MPRPQPALDVRTLSADRKQALLNLLDAHETAVDLGRPTWDLACQLASLRQSGVTDTVLRWLVTQELAEHRLETTRAHQKKRAFRRAPNLRFTAASCFLLTAAGQTVARQARMLESQL